MEEIRFSVVVATFNRGELIVPTIRSALQQTYPASEIIVVGDACTDRTGEVLADTFGNRIIWHNRASNGGSQSFPNNDGIALARGTHIAYLGHDDIWSPDHLAALASTASATGADIVVSGAIYHMPEGSDFWQITGIFDDPSAARHEFFPPSSFAHRRNLTDDIGPWPDPMTTKLPVDSDLVLRAAAAGCRFVSTGRVTVHKFAAGHRYLSYRFPSMHEQAAMLQRLSGTEAERTLLAQVLDRVARGGTLMTSAHVDPNKLAAGAVFARNTAGKGLRLGPPVEVTRSTVLPLDRTPGALDWHDVEIHPRYGPVRWSGRNPNPVWLVNARIGRPFSLQVPIAAVADQALLSGLRIFLDDQPTAFDLAKTSDGSHVLTLAPKLPLPVESGLKLTFETWRRGAIAGDIRDRRFALGPVRVEIDNPLAQAIAGRTR